ncbi:MAG TPA: helicase HerA-like domain-containing protein [Polyangiaceae bacterium]|jgi:hypothetical protein|nr:helicase HerA-like domain-containing protein [Polyangiaceae bacterium]
MSKAPAFYLGDCCAINAASRTAALHLPAHHLVTHGVVVGMTGSGKTGLVTVVVEEALRTGVPVLMIDVKGDLPNLFLSFADSDPSRFVPWVNGMLAPGDERSVLEVARSLAEERRQALESWDLGGDAARRFSEQRALRLITPGSSAGESLHVLSALERSTERWQRDPDAARSALSAAISLVLRLVGRDADAARSREHVLLSVLAERRLTLGEAADLAALLADLETLPISEIGALKVERYLPKKERQALAAALNNLLASPTFAAWRQGVTLDVGDWLTARPAEDGSLTRTPGVIVSVAHLDDEERGLVLGVLLEEVLTWVRGLSGSRKLQALIVFDEVYGFLPPHPANPPTKRPLVALMKQARAFGVGVLVATQNPMDLDYRTLGNAGLWCIGRLQTDADRARVIDGLAQGDRDLDLLLDKTVQRITPRWFVLRDVHAGPNPVLLQPRHALSFLRGPMTRQEMQRAVGLWSNSEAGERQAMTSRAGSATKVTS